MKLDMTIMQKLQDQVIAIGTIPECAFSADCATSCGSCSGDCKGSAFFD